MFGRSTLTGLIVAAIVVQTTAGRGRDAVLDQLNATASVQGTKEAKAWEGFFGACLELTPPPAPLGETFNMNTVWPGMPSWNGVDAWAEENEHMEGAVLEAAQRVVIGLPYGAERVPANFRAAGIVADVGAGGQLHRLNFGYIDTVRVETVWATAYAYKLLEAGETQRALRLTMAQLVVLRKFCDREFLEEKIAFMSMLSGGLENMRDMFYSYRDKISVNQFRTLASDEIPFLRADATHLLMPEGDRVVALALIGELFDSNGRPDTAKFREILTDIQAEREPLTRFGASRYWEEISHIHDGDGTSRDRLNLIYDDWWRRWRMRAYHPMLEADTELQRANVVRHGAVILAIRDIQELFLQRDVLETEINGTAIAAALCGYRNHFGVFPASPKKTYAQFIGRLMNADRFRPLTLRSDGDWVTYDREVEEFHYQCLSSPTSIDTPMGRAEIPADECLLYSVGGDHENNGGTDHTGIVAGGDFVIWPPVKSLERAAGLVD